MSTRVQLDPVTAELLDGIDEFYIQQQIRWGEAVTQGCFEQKNIYHVYNKANNTKIMVIKEESGDLNRCCCAPEHSFFAEFYLADTVADGVTEGVQPVMTMEREGCDCFSPCPKPCLCWFACSEKCSDKSTLYAGGFPDGTIPGELDGARDKTNMLGEVIQPLGGGRFKPVLQIMDRTDGPDDSSTTMFAATRGPCFFGGCSELCCSSEFGISQAKDGMGVDEIHQLTFDYATITKIRPKSMSQALREALTDVDIYDVAFKEGGVTAQQKANTLAAMVLMDYMFFERDNDMCAYDGRHVTITICNCFIYGCVCPCSLSFDTQGGSDSSN